MTGASRHSVLPAYISLVCGFAVSWAVGLSVVFFVGSSSGWTLFGVMQGLTLAFVSESFQPNVGITRLLILVSGWILGGVAAIPTAKYDILTGWLFIGSIGGIVTALTFVKVRFTWPSAIGTAATWLVGGLVGAPCGSTFGKVIGTYLAGGIGRYAPFMVWSIAWAVAGGITGLIGFAGLLLMPAVQARNSEA